MMDFSTPRLTVLVGNYGSGKTEIALNIARGLAKGGCPTALVDLDIVNPYFRSAEKKEVLEQYKQELESITAKINEEFLVVKENIEKLDTVDGINIYKFDYIDGAKDQVGVIAQEMQEKCPECVVNGEILKVDYSRLPEKVQARIEELR